MSEERKSGLKLNVTIKAMEELLKYAEQNGSQSAPLLKDILLEINNLLRSDRITILGGLYDKLSKGVALTESEIASCGISTDSMKKWAAEGRYPSVRAIDPTRSIEYAGSGGELHLISTAQSINTRVKLILPLSPFSSERLEITADYYTYENISVALVKA